MKRKFIILFFMALVSDSILGQMVTNTDFRREGNNFIISYNLSGAKIDLKYFVSLYLSTDGGKTFTGPLKAVTGDVGEINPEGRKTITWNFFDEYETLSGDIGFDIRVETEHIPLPVKNILLYSYSETAPFGAMFVSMHRFGWYISFRTNGVFSGEGTYTCNDESLIDYTGDGYYIFGSETKKVRYSAHAGAVARVSKNMFLYAGAGYGKRNLLWHITEYSYVNDTETDDFYVSHEDYQHTGVEGEGGIGLMFGKFSLCAGANYINKGHIELTGSLGFEF